MLYFDFKQLFYSATADKHKISNSTSDPAILTNLLNLVFYVLNPLRIKLGVAITIVCAYRGTALNALLPGSSTTSQHCLGQAADIMIAGMTPEQGFDYIRHSGIEYDQLILEHNPTGDCLHISFALGKNRKEALIRARDMKTYKRV